MKKTILFILVLATPCANAQLPSVETTTAVRQPIVQQVKVTGTITSPQTSTLSAAVAGIVQDLEVDVGSVVETGDLLLRLDPELAGIAEARAQASESEARVALSDARRRLAEAERLLSDRSIAATTHQSLQSEVAMNEASLQAATAALHEQQALLRRHEIRAPFDGVISQRITEVGEWVNPGNPVLELTATQDLHFDFRVSQEHFVRLNEQTPVSLTVDAMSGELSGKVAAIVPVNDPAARTFLLRVTSANASALGITPGMSARATLNLATGRQSVVIPRDALLRYPDGRTTVWVITTGNDQTIVNEQVVSVGLDGGGVIEILSGLNGGEVVVTRGNEALQPGQAVNIRSRGTE